MVGGSELNNDRRSKGKAESNNQQEIPMNEKHCPNCQQVTLHRRQIGVGTLMLVVMTAGLWLMAIAFYRPRCYICGC